MGRKRLKLEIIEKEKSRMVSYKKRKEGLVRKMHEFTTLCDVNACMIIYGPKQENGIVEPEIWPAEPDKVREMIDIYKTKKGDSNKKTFGLKDFLDERMKKIEEELSKLREKNMKAKYPTTLDDNMKNMTEGQLRQFAADLSNKAEHVRAKIEILKGSPNKQGVMDTNNLMRFGNATLNGQFYPSPLQQIPMHTHIPIHYPTTIDHHHQQLQYPINQNSMMMLLMNGGDQFGGGSTSGVDLGSYRNQVFYEVGSSPGGSGARYYGQPLQLLPPPLGYVVAPPEMHFPTGWENYDGKL